MKGPLNNSRHLQASYNERERFWSVNRHDLAVFDSEVVEGVAHGQGIFWFVFEANQRAILKQKEVSCSPIFYMFSCKSCKLLKYSEKKSLYKYFQSLVRSKWLSVVN
jgi:hypothetical protein